MPSRGVEAILQERGGRKGRADWHLLHGDGGGHGGGQLDATAALHQLDGVLHLHLVIEGDELRLLGALAGDQALLHILLIEAVHPKGCRGRRGDVSDTLLSRHVTKTSAMAL